MTTIFESLKTAEINLSGVKGINNIMPLFLANIQLHNSVVLLSKGYDLSEEIEPLLEKYGDVEGVPNKKDLI